MTYLMEKRNFEHHNAHVDKTLFLIIIIVIK